MSEHRYKLIYTLASKPKGLLKKNIPKGAGACDSMVCISMINLDDGGYSQHVLTLDGATEKPVTANQLFKVWSLLTKHLADNVLLSDDKREFCAGIFDVIRRSILAASKKETA